MYFISCNTPHSAFFVCIGFDCSVYQAKGCTMNSLYFFALMLLRRHVLASTIWFGTLVPIVPLAAQQQPLSIDSGAVSNQWSGEHWVCTWATAQQLAPMTFPVGNSPARKPPLQKDGSPLQDSGRSSSPVIFDIPSNLENQTVRMMRVIRQWRMPSIQKYFRTKTDQPGRRKQPWGN